MVKNYLIVPVLSSLLISQTSNADYCKKFQKKVANLSNGISIVESNKDSINPEIYLSELAMLQQKKLTDLEDMVSCLDSPEFPISDDVYSLVKARGDLAETHYKLGNLNLFNSSSNENILENVNFKSSSDNNLELALSHFGKAVSLSPKNDRYIDSLGYASLVFNYAYQGNLF